MIVLVAASQTWDNVVEEAEHYILKSITKGLIRKVILMSMEHKNMDEVVVGGDVRIAVCGPKIAGNVVSMVFLLDEVSQSSQPILTNVVY